jgi:C-terminal processing protease CtpA/Prc
MLRATIGALVTLIVVTPAFAQSEFRGFDRAAIDREAAAVVDAFAQEYFDISVSLRVADELRRRVMAGHYGGAATAADMAKQLTADFFELTRDRHISVVPTRPGTGAAGQARRDVPTTNGFTRTEIVPGNVGVLELAFFLRPAEHRDALEDAMRALQPADALILDMRGNGGGSPDTVALLASYLIDPPGALLFDIIHRDQSRDAYRTSAVTASLVNARRPIYVLTSRRTFSAGEGLAFILQERKRALVVGERTVGAANPGRGYPAGTLFEITVPNGRVVSAIAGRNWEGQGVEPNVATDASEAFRVAHVRAIDDLIAKASTAARRDELKRIRAAVGQR